MNAVLSSVVRINGIAFGWTAATSALASVP
jgi:hypothetical protein